MRGALLGFAAGALVGVVATATWLRAPDAEERAPARVKVTELPTSAAPAPPVSAGARDPLELGAPSPELHEAPGIAPLDGPAWDALVGGALERHVAARGERELTPEARERLVRRLAELRDASLGLQSDPDDTRAVQLQQRLARTLAIVEADRAFRAELGLGVAEFLAGLDPGAIEDVSRRP